MYQNLVGSVRPEAYESIHHTTWPEVDKASIDEALIEQMSLARRVASLGLSARKNANLKVRQPLSKVMVYAGKAGLRQELVDIVDDELNVKAFEFVEQEGALVQYKVLPDNKLLGPKFGARFPQVKAALAQADPNKVAASVRAGLPVILEVADEPVELDPESILVSTEPLPGLAVAADKYITVGIDAALTPPSKRRAWHARSYAGCRRCAKMPASILKIASPPAIRLRDSWQKCLPPGLSTLPPRRSPPACWMPLPWKALMWKSTSWKARSSSWR